MRDKYNLNTLPPGVMPEDAELMDDHHAPNIPGMGPEDKVEAEGGGDGNPSQNGIAGLSAGMIPGLDVEPSVQDVKPIKKVPYAKPIPRNFQAQWNENPGKKPAILPTPHLGATGGQSDDEDGFVLGVDPVAFGMEQLGRATLSLFGLPANDPEQLREMLDTAQSLPASSLPTPTAVIIDGSTILPIEADSELDKAIRTGEEELVQVLSSMGLKVSIEEEESKPEITPVHNYYNQDKELDDDEFYPRSRTPVLDDSPGYNRGHSGIGPTPTGGLLGDFPRGNFPVETFELL